MRVAATRIVYFLRRVQLELWGTGRERNGGIIIAALLWAKKQMDRVRRVTGAGNVLYASSEVHGTLKRKV